MSAVQNAVQTLTTLNTAGDFYGTTTTGSSISATCSTCGCWYTGYHDCIQLYPWYPVYWAPPQVDKMQTAFRLVKHLMSKDMVKLDKIEDFIALVDEIATMI